MHHSMSSRASFVFKNSGMVPGASLATELALDEKPFQLAKWFSIIAVILIFAASLTLAAVVSRRAEVIISTRVEEDTVKLMENLNYQMFDNFLLVAKERYGNIHLRDPEQNALLDGVIKKTIHGFDIDRVLIYNLEGQAVYSTNPELILNFADNMGAYLEAIRIYYLPDRRYLPTKEPAFKVAPASLADETAMEREILIKKLKALTVQRYEGGGYVLGGFFPKGTFVLHSYKAMENYGTTGISGVLEISRDLTPEYRQIAKLQYFAFGVAFFLSILVTVALRLAVSRGEAIIMKRNAERQQLQEQLGQAERLAGLGSMVATVAHEIRNPLGIIHSTADLLKDFLAGNHEQARLANAILEESDRLSEVVTEFLDFARPQTPNLEPVVVEDILEEVLAFLEILLSRAGVEVRTAFREEQAAVPGDPGMLYRAFLNLIINAIQAMPDGGLLTVAVKEKELSEYGRSLIIEIDDTGQGLSADEAKKIFSPFFTTKAKGSGLGLVIVRNIIESHNGDIKLSSGINEKDENEDGVGPGLKVVIRLHF